ncbi:hypothetical protein CYMTET_46886 [Cymbomonas tetramitiformis]|uniref:Uncharacterized protein n=1 Tax=Cymbomonas tetramitiformis TaxID=36881 RepID=A0AAE0EY92_9CHLO|nr:hypothetical protein CYMTET_46886 [Cymbomonas tetramitiformis]
MAVSPRPEGPALMGDAPPYPHMLSACASTLDVRTMRWGCGATRRRGHHRGRRHRGHHRGRRHGNHHRKRGRVTATEGAAAVTTTEGAGTEAIIDNNAIVTAAV